MFKIMTAEEAVSLVKDGDMIGVNSFLYLSAPDGLHNALRDRIEKTGHPMHLSMFSTNAMGDKTGKRGPDIYAALGAIDCVIAGHYSNMPVIRRLIREKKIEAYNMPIGMLCGALKAAASGSGGCLTKVGLNIFVDPRLDGPGLNERSKRELVSVCELMGEEHLYMKAPKLDIAFIKGSTVDPGGNITFEDELIMGDALEYAEAVKENGGKVIVEVNQVSHVYARPRSVIIPGIMVDAVVVNNSGGAGGGAGFIQTLRGDIHVPPTQMSYWIREMTKGRGPVSDERRECQKIIGEHAVKLLKPGQIINLGIGMPEIVGEMAASSGKAENLCFTVESGGIGGVPAQGEFFGATIGADTVISSSYIFDFYDGGGLDICFMGGLEADMHGNVNSHGSGEKYAGIGGFANITHRTKNIVFCMTFTTKGLRVSRNGGRVVIEEEGRVNKFVKNVAAVSFSSKNAVNNGQNVYYVTERCVFELTPRGLRLREVYPGIDEKTQIRDLLDFELAD